MHAAAAARTARTRRQRRRHARSLTSSSSSSVSSSSSSSSSSSFSPRRRGVWPRNSKGEQVKFKIVPKQGYVGLPLAHTCFFLLECGTGYTSYEAMRRAFVTAIVYGAREGFSIRA